MSNRSYRLQVGDITCTVLADGLAPIADITGVFTNIADDVLDAAISAGGPPRDQLANHYNCLLIETDGQRILVDTGSGDVGRDTVGWLVDSLAEVDVTPEMIDVVFISHFHGDHINGLSDADGAETFPNARYITARAEWEGWLGEEAAAKFSLERLDGLRKKLLPLERKFTLVEFDTTIAPGVTVLAATGHTPGHAALMIESNGDTLFYLVDAAHRIFQLHNPDLSPRFDSLPDVSPVTRRALLQRACDDSLLTLFYHFPFPGLGHVVAAGEAFRWQPIEAG